MERSPYIVKHLSSNRCKSITSTIIAKMFNITTEFYPNFPDYERKAIIMYYWARAQQGNLHSWDAWSLIHSYATSLKHRNITIDWYAKHIAYRDLKDVSDYYYKAYLASCEKKIAEIDKQERRLRAAQEIIKLGSNLTYKKYADVAVPAFDRCLKSNVTLAK